MRGGRPATTIYSPSHILLIFSSEPPRNPRPSNIIFQKCLCLQDKTICEESGHVRAEMKYSGWFHGENDWQRYDKYFAICFISRRLTITEAEEF